MVLPPELAERARSDGAELIVSVTVEGGITTSHSARAGAGSRSPVRVSGPSWTLRATKSA